MRTSRFTCLVLVAVAAAALSGVLGGPTPSHAGLRSRAGTIAFLRFPPGGWERGGGGAGLFVIQADGSGLRRLTLPGSDVESYQWSPDGSRIAYLDSRGALRVVRPDGAGRRLLAAG